MNRRRLLLGLFLIFLSASFTPIPASDDQGCYSIVAGKAATADGSVLLGHNEDNAPECGAGLVKVERKKHEPGTFVSFGEGGQIPQVEITWSYLWLKMPERLFSDALLNEHGVAIVSNSCPSREDAPELEHGGIGGPVLRRLVAERARSAREGVELLGSLVDQYGYSASGRVMAVCDAEEGWIVALVRGKHWAAARVPDDEVALVANTYTLRSVDLGNPDRFLGSADLLEYAARRGWWDPEEGPFSFEAAYAHPGARNHTGNTHRQWSGLNLLALEPVLLPEKGRLPFSVKPNEPLTVEDLAEVLRNHYEGTPYEKDRSSVNGSPHRNRSSPTCSKNTNSSSIFQLRSGMPVEIGALWWCALWSPCSTPYLPLYFGMNAVPNPLRFHEVPDPRLIFEDEEPLPPAPAYLLFKEFARWVDQDYGGRIASVRKRWRDLERASFDFQKTLEEFAMSRWKQDPAMVREILARFSGGAVSDALQSAEDLAGLE